MSEWKENTGVVPEGVTAETSIEVEYADKSVIVWRAHQNPGLHDGPDLWELLGDSQDVVRWRFFNDQ